MNAVELYGAFQLLVIFLGGVIAACGGLAFLKRIYGATKTALKERWPETTKYVGYVEHGIRIAERGIPDDTPNRALRRFDQALKAACELFERGEGHSPQPSERAEMARAIPRSHRSLERDGVLKEKTCSDD